MQSLPTTGNLAKFIPLLLCAFAALAVLSPTVGSRSDKLNLFPILHAGQSISYLVRYRNDKTVKTKSTVATPMAPDSLQLDAHGLLVVEIVSVQPSGSRASIHVKTRFQALDSGAWLKHPGQKAPDWTATRIPSEDKFVEFTIRPDGSVADLQGLDALLPEQQQAWQEWLRQFAIAGGFPQDGVKPGDKWKADETETSPSPIAGLEWNKEATYVRNEPCSAMRMTLTGDVSPLEQSKETCAVILTNASLRQKSSTNDATPDDYRIRELHTSGTAKGKNEVIIYVSLNTGLIVRATDESEQSMDVLITKTDGSNSIHYLVNAKSHGEVLLVTETPLPPQ